MPYLEKYRNDELKRCYDEELEQYQRRMALYRKEHDDWSSRREGETTHATSWGLWESMVFAAVFGFIGNLVFPVIGAFIGFFVGLGIRQFFWEREQAKLDAAFVRNNPEPPNPNLKQPDSPKAISIEFDLDKTEFADYFDPTNYRKQILERDQYTCQCCGERKREEDLEVHHIQMQADGGPHHPKNLITLCLHCHDREKWFGHVRMFPTTLKRRR